MPAPARITHAMADDEEAFALSIAAVTLSGDEGDAEEAFAGCIAASTLPGDSAAPPSPKRRARCLACLVLHCDAGALCLSCLALCWPTLCWLAPPSAPAVRCSPSCSRRQSALSRLS